jgi:hypothetical protein
MISQDPNPEVPWLGWYWCQCCGVRVMLKPNIRLSEHRCGQHRYRNPCAIEGCKRSTAAPRGQLALDQWLCSEHWRIGCPPRSRERRIYLRFFRRAKRYGWTQQSADSFWRIWRRIVAIARSRCAGDIDEAEIRRLFGWDAEAAA